MQLTSITNIQIALQITKYNIFKPLTNLFQPNATHFSVPTFTVNSFTNNNLNFTCNDNSLNPNNNLQFRVFIFRFTSSSKVLTYNNTLSTYNIDFGNITETTITNGVIKIDVINDNYEYFGFTMNCTINANKITAINNIILLTTIPPPRQNDIKFYNPITKVDNLFMILINL